MCSCDTGFQIIDADGRTCDGEIVISNGQCDQYNYGECFSPCKMLMSVVTVPIPVSRYAITQMEHTTASAVMVMNSTVMDSHVQVH